MTESLEWAMGDIEAVAENKGRRNQSRESDGEAW
jgi:hypothetical protein